jgi:hypothetical protein
MLNIFFSDLIYFPGIRYSITNLKKIVPAFMMPSIFQKIFSLGIRQLRRTKGFQTWPLSVSESAWRKSKLVKKPYVSKTVKTPYVTKTQMIFTAKLTGNNAIPPVNTPATGIARFELSSNGKVLNYHLSTTNLKGSKEAAICEKEQNINYTSNKTEETCGSVAQLSIGKRKIT